MARVRSDEGGEGMEGGQGEGDLDESQMAAANTHDFPTPESPIRTT